MILRQTGNGRPLLLLHSLLADGRSVEALASELSQTHRVVIADLPGYGGSPRSTASIPQIAQELMAAMMAEGFKRDLSVLGNGYGGFVALSLAQQFSAAVGRLILLDSAAAFPPAGKQGIQTMLDKVRIGGMSAAVDIGVSRLFPPAYIETHPDVVATYRAALLQMDAESFICMCQNLINVDLRPGLSAVRSNTLVIVGLEDHATPAALAREVATTIPDAKLLELAGCGHAPHIQMPEVVIPLIKEFLDEA